MVHNPETIQECIEKARQRLYQIANSHAELMHPEVIRQSMVLDELINEYNKAIRIHGKTTRDESPGMR
ncbi:Spo0E family sporulation regulatory protein-aspartic acid phosphatase [Paenibacillus xylanilyticus]|uniref:Spo0E family sporulation regulatory protein-aspartic acid phosphatase n=1 Tax=Paenibacillus xylanilyticus TaxID=248903 RepID=UPI0039A38C5F